MRMLNLSILLVLFSLSACGDDAGRTEAAANRGLDSNKQHVGNPAVPVLPGAAVLFKDGAALLKGKRVGAIVNHTAMVGDVNLVDTLRGTGIDVSIIFSPEHGFRGNADAGAKIDNSIDERTGIPIFSLYGSNRAPTPESLAEVDALVFDIQDVGARFYTYISTLGLSMQAAAKQGIPFIVLDRPNPLGGEYVSGFVLDPEVQSYVGMYPIPIAHGLTVGELARMIVGERYLADLDGLDLRIVEVEGWNRAMRWPETGLDWIPPSPNLPTFETALLYPGTCLIEATTASEGRGTQTPFKLLGAPWLDSAELVNELGFDSNGTPINDQNVGRSRGGVRIVANSFKPVSIVGMSTNPKHRDVELGGIRIDVVAADAIDPVALGIDLLVAMNNQARAAGESEFVRESGLRRLSGSTDLFGMLAKETSPDTIVESWADEVAAFKAQRQPYLLYR